MRARSDLIFRIRAARRSVVERDELAISCKYEDAGGLLA